MTSVPEGCPCCGQGWLYRVRFPEIDRESFMCDDCNVVWLTLDGVNQDSGAALHILMSWQGFRDECEDGALELLERVDWPRRE